MFSLTFFSVLATLSVFTHAIPLSMRQTPAAAASKPPKQVFAHFMVGFVFPYTQADWASDIAAASNAGIDGFALNVGPDSFQPARVADAYAAAQAAGNGFKLFFSFDMSALPCKAAGDAQTLRNFIKTYSTHPNQLLVDGKVFASTFTGESCTFGQASVAQGWKTQFTQHPELTGVNAVSFNPSFFIDPATFNQFGGVMDGAFNFNSGWPIGVTDQTVLNIAPSGTKETALAAVLPKIQPNLASFIGDTTTDDQYISGLAAIGGAQKLYMAAVAPWFYTHYSPQTFNKNFIFLADQHLYATRWEKVIAHRNNIDLVEIVTWNDYSESHYISPISPHADQPNSQAWVNGFDHTAWLNMTKYYVQAFKTGSFPAITQDKLFMWARPHPAQAITSDPVGQPANFAMTSDTLWAVAFTTAPANVTINSQTFAVPAGVTKLSTPLNPGDGMSGTILNGGKQTVVKTNFSFTSTPSAYNFNAFTASSHVTLYF